MDTSIIIATAYTLDFIYSIIFCLSIVVWDHPLDNLINHLAKRFMATFLSRLVICEYECILAYTLNEEDVVKYD